MGNLIDLKKNCVRNLKKVVLIVHYGNSGTYFLHSLLDGHPNIITLPGAMLVHFSAFWSLYGRLPAPQLAEKFIEDYEVLFDSQKPGRLHHRYDVGYFVGFTTMGPGRNERIEVDKEKFKENLINLISGEVRTRRLLFQAIHCAYAEATGIKIETSNFLILYHIHWATADSLWDFIIDFPDIKVIHTIRTPIHSLGSNIKWGLGVGEAVRGKSMDFLECSMKVILFSGKPILPRYSNESRAVRLEDLHSDPRKTLERLCTWLEIPWDDCLLKSTFNGIQYWNKPNLKQVSGFSKEIINKTHTDIFTSFDRFRLSILLQEKYVSWRYPLSKTYRMTIIKVLTLPLYLIPFKFELIMVQDALKSNNKGQFLLIKSFLKVRRIIYLAWVDMIFNKKKEVQLI